MYPIFAGKYFVNGEPHALIFYFNQLKRCWEVEKYKSILN